MKKIAVICLLLLLIWQISAQECPGPKTAFMVSSDAGNAHAGTKSGSSYGYCANLDREIVGDPNNQLWLSNADNAHVSTYRTGEYNTGVSIGQIYFDTGEAIGDVCDLLGPVTDPDADQCERNYEDCMFSLKGKEDDVGIINAHVAPCNTLGYYNFCCLHHYCADNYIDNYLDEECDCGPDFLGCASEGLGGETCESLGYDSGTLGCHPPGNPEACTFDTSGCYSSTCPNGVCDIADGECGFCPQDCTCTDCGCSDDVLGTCEPVSETCVDCADDVDCDEYYEGETIDEFCCTSDSGTLTGPYEEGASVCYDEVSTISCGPPEKSENECYYGATRFLVEDCPCYDDVFDNENREYNGICVECTLNTHCPTDGRHNYRCNGNVLEYEYRDYSCDDASHSCVYNIVPPNPRTRICQDDTPDCYASADGATGRCRCDKNTRCTGKECGYVCENVGCGDNNGECPSGETCNEGQCELVSVSDAFWANLIDSIETARANPLDEAEVGDTVRLVFENAGTEGGTVDFEIKEADCLVLCDYDDLVTLRGTINSDEDAIATWTITPEIMGMSGVGDDYGAEAEFVFFVNSEESNKLIVQKNSEDDTPPVINILSPENKEIYYLGEELTFTFEIEDPDDTYTFQWDFDDRTTSEEFTEVEPKTHVYNIGAQGQRTIKLIATQEHRDNQEYIERVSILLVNPSGTEYVFAFIDEPPWGEVSQGKDVNFNAASSFAINAICPAEGGRPDPCDIRCLAGGCLLSTRTGPGGQDIYDTEGNRGDYSHLKFAWIFDNGLEGTYTKFGENNCNSGTNGCLFTKRFGDFGKHTAGLDITYIH